MDLRASGIFYNPRTGQRGVVWATCGDGAINQNDLPADWDRRPCATRSPKSADLEAGLIARLGRVARTIGYELVDDYPDLARGFLDVGLRCAEMVGRPPSAWTPSGPRLWRWSRRGRGGGVTW